MQKVDILILTAMHRRPLVSELFAMAVNELVKAHSPRFRFAVVALVSDLESKEVCKRYGIDMIETVISPLGTKMNTGLQIAMERYLFRYLLHLGDDDVVSPLLIDAYAPFMADDYPYFGVNNLYFLDSMTSLAAEFQYKQPTSKLVGAGRMFSHDALMNTAWQCQVIPLKSKSFLGVQLTKNEPVYLPCYQAEYLDAMGMAASMRNDRVKLWRDDQHTGLDAQSELSMVMNNYFPVVVPVDRPLITDVKSTVNIWKFSQFSDLGKPVSQQEATWFWSDACREYYKQMRVKLQSL